MAGSRSRAAPDSSGRSGRFVDRTGSGDLSRRSAARRHRGDAAEPSRTRPPGRSLEAAAVGPVRRRSADPRGRSPRRTNCTTASIRSGSPSPRPRWRRRGPSSRSKGHTAYGDRSRHPVSRHQRATGRKATACSRGSSPRSARTTRRVPVGGSGKFDGVMPAPFRAPADRGTFRGERMRAWDVTWGRATGDLVIENGYVTITNARRRGDGDRRSSRPTAASRSAIPRSDGGEEINARIKCAARPLADLRHAFGLDD